MALTDSYVKKEFDKSFELEEERKGALLEAMGLEDRDINRLQKSMLSASEAIAAKEEELRNIRQHRGQKTDWEEFVDRKRRMGRIMHHSEFIRLLRQAIPSIVVAPGGQRNRLGLYAMRNMPREEVSGYTGNWDHVDVPIYIGFIEEGLMPEYEVDLVNSEGTAIGQWRGWRTILLRLIARRTRCHDCLQGEKPKPLPCPNNIPGCGRPTSILQEDKAYDVFGWPTNGATASYFRKTLWEFRKGLR
jgi:hypothetical protein